MDKTLQHALFAGRASTRNGVAADVRRAATPVTSEEAVSASGQARIAAIVLLLVGVGIALAWKESKPSFQAADGFVLLTGFYIAAQAIERVLELLPAGTGSKQAKADRVVIFGSLGFILAVILAEAMGLYLLEAVSDNDLNGNLDVIVTALAIGGGTKPLHDLISRIQKA